MFCTKCGAHNHDQAIACFQCGQTLQAATPPANPYGMPPTLPYGAPYQQPGAGSGKAVASLVLGIVSLLAWCLPLFGLPVSIIGLVLGVKATKSSSRGMAIAGIVLSIIGLLFSLINAAVGAYQGATGQAWWQHMGR